MDINGIREKLKEKNGVTEIKKPSDKQRIAQLETEKADLQVQLEEAQDALIELAELIAEVE